MCNLANSVFNSGWVWAVSLEIKICYLLGDNEKENQDSRESYLNSQCVSKSHYGFTEEQGKNPPLELKILINGNKISKIPSHRNQQSPQSNQNSQKQMFFFLTYIKTGKFQLTYNLSSTCCGLGILYPS